ncbi:MAG: hypothetical protein WA160_08675 [Pseudobdellovibrio sp.]
MNLDITFSEILEFYVDETVTSNDPFLNQTLTSDSINSGWQTILDPAGLAFLIGQTPIYTIPKKYKSTYQRPAHVFSDEQAVAFMELCQWASTLKNNFNLKELKSNYRQALLKTHPDQGGSCESFWSVKKSYEVLSSLVKS